MDRENRTHQKTTIPEKTISTTGNQMARPPRKKARIDPALVRKIQEENDCTLQEAVSIANGLTLPENADKEGKGSRLERAICLAYAKGALPSVIADELEMTIEEVQDKVKVNSEHIQRLVELLGMDYQRIRIDNIFDYGLRKIEEIALDRESNHKDVMDVMKDLIKWRKDGDLDKLFDNKTLNETYEDVPDDVRTLDEEIEKLKKKLQGEINLG